MNGWIAVDLDGTLAEYHGWPADGSIGKPIPEMVERVKGWLAEGKDVRIFTARVWPLRTHDEAEVVYHTPDPLDEALASGFTKVIRTDRAMQALTQKDRIQKWCLEHLGKVLPITCIKDYEMVSLWDDRAVQVQPNTGKTIEEAVREEMREQAKWDAIEQDELDSLKP